MTKLCCFILFAVTASFAQTCSTVAGSNPAVTLCQGYRYSAHSSELAGEPERVYDVYYLSSAGPNNKGRQCIYWHGGGWRGTRGGYQVKGDAQLFMVRLAQNYCGAVYNPAYTLSARMSLKSPIDSKATSLDLEFDSLNGLVPYFPTGGTYKVVVDQENSLAETMTVTSQSGSGNDVKVNVTRGHGALAHSGGWKGFLFLGSNKGLYRVTTAGSGGTPGTYPLGFSGSSCSGSAPSGTYTVGSNGSISGFAVGSLGVGCTSLSVSFPNGPTNASGTAQYVGAGVTVPETQWPVPGNDLAAFHSFLAHCAAAGASHVTGSCSSYAQNPVPGNPMDQVVFGDSAGAHLSAMIALTGTSLLNTNVGTPGYSEWTDTGWKVRAYAVWSLPADLFTMFQTSWGFGNAQMALISLLGRYPAASDAASPVHYLSPANPPGLVINGTLDPITPNGQASELYATGTAVGVAVTGQSHELDVWKFPGVTLGAVYSFLEAEGGKGW